MVTNALGRVYNRVRILICHVGVNIARLLSFLSSRVSRSRTRPKPGLSDIWITLVRLVAISIITTGIIWGAIGFHVHLEETTVLWYHVEGDLQLGLLGLFNKVSDVLLVSSLEYRASILIRTWMTA
jgi:hypothetical protein